MNILYIGPFQLNSTLGYESAILLKYLCDNAKDNNIYAYPLYSGYDDTEVSNIPYIRLKELSDMPDIVISHCLIETLSINRYSKNYLIPIHDQDLSVPSKYIQKLSRLDGVLVFNDFEYDKYSDVGISSEKIYKIKYPQIQSSMDKIDIGIYQTYKKYYFIGDYEQDKDSIKSLIKSFLSATRFTNDICLIICCKCDSLEKTQLIKDYESYKSELKIIGEDKILFLLDNISTNKIDALHNTCDILFAINNANQSIIHSAIASAKNKKIITYSDCQLDEIEHCDHKRYEILTKSIIDIIRNEDISQPQKNKYTAHQIIDIL